MKKGMSEKLFAAYDDCKGKSIMYTIQYMMDSTGASHREVMDFLYKRRDKKEGE